MKSLGEKLGEPCGFWVSKKLRRSVCEFSLIQRFLAIWLGRWLSLSLSIYILFVRVHTVTASTVANLLLVVGRWAEIFLSRESGDLGRWIEEAWEYIQFLIWPFMSGMGIGVVCVWVRTGERVCAGNGSRWIWGFCWFRWPNPENESGKDKEKETSHKEEGKD